QFTGRRSELPSLYLLRPGNGSDQRVARERVDLIEEHDRNHQPVAIVRRCYRAAEADYCADPRAVMRLRPGDEKIDICKIARLQDVGLEPLNCEHPTHLPCEIAILALRQDLMEGLLIRPSCRLGATDYLRHLLFD